MIYKVTKRYSRGNETPVGTYKTINEAKDIIRTIMEEDMLHKIVATYCLYEGIDLLEEIVQTSQNQSTQESHQNNDNQSTAGAGQRFSPSPFNTKPLPKGMPNPNWKNDSSEKEK